MHLSRLLQNLFHPSSINMDKRNQKTIIDCSVALSECKTLSIASIGRHLISETSMKHNIKRVDRLFGNNHVQQNRMDYYRTMASYLIPNNSRPVISIDWSGLTPCGEFHFIRAAIAVGGRAMPLFESCYTEHEYTKSYIHANFLEQLRTILPDECRPIIVTDAGFRCPWFILVRSFGWDFVGRIRNRTQFQVINDDNWQFVASLYSTIQSKPHYLFQGILARNNPVTGYFHGYRSKAQHRKHKNLRGHRVRCASSLKHAKRGREPWLLFTSLSPTEFNSNAIKNIYAGRMEIEESFRDLKNTLNGLSLRHCRSYEKGRLNIALLLGAIAFFIIWLSGLIAKQQKLHVGYQANTVKHRNVLSTFFIGYYFLKQTAFKLTKDQLDRALKTIRKNAQCYA